MRDDDWFLCRRDKCAIKASEAAAVYGKGLESQIARLQERLEAVTRERTVSINDPREVEEANIRADLAIDRMHKAEARAARLEVALWEYENPSNWGVNGRFDANSPRFDGTSFAHSILAAIDVKEAG
jgi:hypothetical protein